MYLTNRLLLTLLTTGALTACGGGSPSDSDNDTTDTSASSSRDSVVSDSAVSNTTEEPTDEGTAGFELSARSPAADARNRALVSDLRLTFSGSLIDATVTPEAIQLLHGGEPVATRLDYETGSDTVTLTPAEPLQPDARYRVQVSDELMASDGTQFAGASWTFETAPNVGATTQSVIDSCMSERDLETLGRLNNARASARACGDEHKPAAEPLSWSCELEDVALGHSQDMAENDFFSHTGTDGATVSGRLNAAGYPWETAAENIAAGQQSVEQAVGELLASPGHCVNIMNQRFTQVGAAMAENPEAYYQRYWTQNFARPW